MLGSSVSPSLVQTSPSGAASTVPPWRSQPGPERELAKQSPLSGRPDTTLVLDLGLADDNHAVEREGEQFLSHGTSHRYSMPRWRHALGRFILRLLVPGWAWQTPR